MPQGWSNFVTVCVCVCGVDDDWTVWKDWSLCSTFYGDWLVNLSVTKGKVNSISSRKQVMGLNTFLCSCLYNKWPVRCKRELHHHNCPTMMFFLPWIKEDNILCPYFLFIQFPKTLRCSFGIRIQQNNCIYILAFLMFYLIKQVQREVLQVLAFAHMGDCCQLMQLYFIVWSGTPLKWKPLKYTD